MHIFDGRTRHDENCADHDFLRRLLIDHDSLLNGPLWDLIPVKPSYGMKQAAWAEAKQNRNQSHRSVVKGVDSASMALGANCRLALCCFHILWRKDSESFPKGHSSLSWNYYCVQCHLWQYIPCRHWPYGAGKFPRNPIIMQPVPGIKRLIARLDGGLKLAAVSQPDRGASQGSPRDTC